MGIALNIDHQFICVGSADGRSFSQTSRFITHFGFFNCSVVSYGNAHIAGIVGIIVSSYRSAVLAESVFDGGMALNDDLRVCVAVADGSASVR